MENIAAPKTPRDMVQKREITQLLPTTRQTVQTPIEYKGCSTSNQAHINSNPGNNQAP